MLREEPNFYKDTILLTSVKKVKCFSCNQNIVLDAERSTLFLQGHAVMTKCRQLER